MTFTLALEAMGCSDDSSHAAVEPEPDAAPTRTDRDPNDWPADCEATYLFAAHGKPAPGDKSKYRLPPRAQHLVLFYFAAPWRGDVQLLELRPVPDNPKVVHHWTLYTMVGLGARDGEIQGGNGSFAMPPASGAVGLHTAGPGSTAVVMPEGIGLRMPRGDDLRLVLEVHYFNPSDTDAEDATGIEVCTTSKKRPIEAASRSRTACSHPSS